MTRRQATTTFSSPIAFIPTTAATAATSTAPAGVSMPMSASADAANVAADAVAADVAADVDAASNATWRGDVAGVQAEAEELLVQNTELRRALGKLRQTVMLEARTRMAQLKSILKVSILKVSILKVSILKVSILKVSILKVSILKVSILKVSILKVSILKVSILKVSILKVSILKVSILKVSILKVSILKVSILKEIKLVQDQRALTFYVDDRHLPSPPPELKEIAALTARRRPDVDAKEEELVARAQVRVLSLREEIERAVHADLRLSYSRCAASLQHTLEAQQAHTQAMQAYMAAHTTLALRLTALSVLKQPGSAEKLRRLREQPSLLSSPAARNAFLSSLDAPVLKQAGSVERVQRLWEHPSLLSLPAARNAFLSFDAPGSAEKLQQLGEQPSLLSSPAGSTPSSLPLMHQVSLLVVFSLRLTALSVLKQPGSAEKLQQLGEQPSLLSSPAARTTFISSLDAPGESACTFFTGAHGSISAQASSFESTQKRAHGSISAQAAAQWRESAAPERAAQPAPPPTRIEVVCEAPQKPPQRSGEKVQRLREQPSLLHHAPTPSLQPFSPSPRMPSRSITVGGSPLIRVPLPISEASLWSDLLFSASHFPSIFLSTDHHPSRISTMQSLANTQNGTVLALKLRTDHAAAAVKEAKGKLPELCHVSSSWVSPEGADVSPCTLASRISEEEGEGKNRTSKSSGGTEAGAGTETDPKKESGPLSGPLAPSALWRQPLWDLSFPTHPSAFPAFPHSYAFDSPASSPFSSSPFSSFSSLLSSASQSPATAGSSVAEQSTTATDAATADAHTHSHSAESPGSSSASSLPESATSSPATSAAAVNISFLIYTSPPTTAALDLVSKLYECTHGRLRAGSIGGRLGGLTSEALVLLDDWIQATRRTAPGSFLTHILAPSRMGAARAYNLLSLLARGSVLILLAGGDLPPDSCDWAANLVSPFSAWPRLGIAGHSMGKMGLRNVPGSLQLGELRNAGDQFWNRLRDPVTGVRMSFVLGTVTGPMAARRDVFVKVGGFSTIDGGIDALSDWDLCQHVWLSGHQQDAFVASFHDLLCLVLPITGSDSIPQDPFRRQRHDSIGGGIPGAGGMRQMLTPGSAAAAAARQRRMSVQFASGFSKPTGLQLPGTVGGQGGPMTPTAGGNPTTATKKVQKSMMMCMDPTCNACPPEMHALRNKKLMAQVIDEFPEPMARPTRRGGRGGGRGGGGGGDDDDDDSDYDFDDDDDDDDDDYGYDYDAEQGQRTIVRFCGITCFTYTSKPPKRKKRKSRWTKAWQDVQDFFQPISMLWQPWGILNPHSKFMARWNKVFMVACILGFTIDPWFLFTLQALYQVAPQPAMLCLTLDWTAAITFTVLRSFVDLCYVIQIVVQFRMAYIVPPPTNRKNRFFRRWWADRSLQSPGDLEFDARVIASRYLRSWFLIDVLAALPIPQIVMLVIVPMMGRSVPSNTGVAMTVLCLAALFAQNVPRAIRFFPILSGNAPHVTGLVFETAWANFLLNFVFYLMASNIVGSMWYFLAASRFTTCMAGQCATQGDACQPEYMYCVDQNAIAYQNTAAEAVWATGPASACLVADTPGSDAPPSPIDYGIFTNAVPLVVEGAFLSKYIYSFFWGFQQVSTLAGNLEPSRWDPEVLFVILVIGLGLVLLALLIGNISNFLQALSRRSFEYQLQRHDIDSWMERRNLPLSLQKRVQKQQRLHWVATRGVEEAEVLDKLSDDIQTDVRRSLCLELLQCSALFFAMEPQVLDAFCEKLRQQLYIEGTVILKEGYPVSRLFFVLRGQLESYTTIGGRAGFVDSVLLGKGDFLGEELLVEYLEKLSDGNKSRRSSTQIRYLGRSVTMGASASASAAALGTLAIDVLPTAQRTVRCIGPVEGYELEATDVAVVCRQFARMLATSKIQAALKRLKSPLCPSSLEAPQKPSLPVFS
ncbi:unnamed protein product [Closterium sp. NIES-64]|nr:unnamed protein product [Closterium sp. NIES-64]